MGISGGGGRQQDFRFLRAERNNLRGPPARGADRLRGGALPLCPARHGCSQHPLEPSLGAPPGGRARWLLSHRRAPPPPPHAPAASACPSLRPRGPPLSCPPSLCVNCRNSRKLSKDPTVDPSSHLVHWTRRKKMRPRRHPCPPNICPKVPSSGLPKTPLQMRAKGPPRLPSPAGRRAPHVCKSLPASRAPGAPPFRDASGLKKPTTLC